jgi:hypothetical protein
MDGSAYIILSPDDFKNLNRFEQYAEFMKQPKDRVIKIPIDSARAMEIIAIRNLPYGGDANG